MSLRDAKRRFCRSLKNSPLAREFLAELLSTFILMTFGVGSVAQTVLSGTTLGTPLSIHFSWGFAVTMGIYAAGGVSGAHMNPAVSLALACLGKFPWRKLPAYFLGQYLGSFLAACCVYGVYTDALKNYDGGVRTVTGNTATAGIWSTYPQPYVSTLNALGDQIFGTLMLQLCIMGVTDVRNMAIPKGLVPLSVGFVVTVIGMTFGFNCGYAINPARDLSPRIFTAIAGWGAAPFSHRDYNWFWVPIVGPHIGAIIGAFFYQLTVGFYFPGDDDDDDDGGGGGEVTEDAQFLDANNSSKNKGNNCSLAVVSSADVHENSRL